MRRGSEPAPVARAGRRSRVFRSVRSYAPSASHLVFHRPSPARAVPRPRRPAGAVIFDMDTVRHSAASSPDKDNTRCPPARPNGGRQVRQGRPVHLREGASGGFMTGPRPAVARVGPGRRLQLLGQGGRLGELGRHRVGRQGRLRPALRLLLPIDSTEWRKVVVPWRDLTPELAGAAGRRRRHGDPRRLRPERVRELLVRQVVLLARLPGLFVRGRPGRPGAQDRAGDRRGHVLRRRAGAEAAAGEAARRTSRSPS